MKEQLQTREDPQVSTTETDARSMTSDGRATGVVGYNVQAAVDTKHHLIVAHEVTNDGSDFLTRRLEHVSTEMSLHVLAYNLKRVIAILGMRKTMDAMRLVGG